MPAYRLEALLDIRIKAEEEAKDAFSQALKAWEAEKKKVVTMEADLAKRKVERKNKVQAFLEEVTKKGGGINGFQQMNRFEQRLKDEEAQVVLDIERQKEVVVQAEQLMEQRRQEMAEAATQKKAIEKHKDTWKAEVKKQRQDREDMASEEVGQTLHLARVRAAGKTK